MRILVVKLSSLGDILHVLPTVHELRTQLNAEVDWVVHPEFAPLVRCFADVDKVLTFPRHHVLRGLRAAVRDLRATEYDLVVDLHGLFKSGLVARLARAKRRIAPSYAREGSAFFFRERAGRLSRTRHAVEQAFDTLDYLGLERPAKSHRAELRPAEGPPNPDLPDFPDGVRTIAFAPVSRWPSKDWPVARYGELAGFLLARDPALRILVVGGRADISVGDAIVSAAGANDANRILNLCGRTSIAESLALLAKCDLLVANDTGPVHMAAAVGTRCLVLFGPTRPDWTGPYGEGHRIIKRDLPCQPCLKHRCPRGDHACLESITAAEVAGAIRELPAPRARAAADGTATRLHDPGAGHSQPTKV